MWSVATDLADGYERHRSNSPLGQVFETASRWIERLDAVVWVGDVSVLDAASVLVEACGDPYHNERDRADRGSRPRRYWCSPTDDHDSLGAVVHRLRGSAPRPPVGVAVLGHAGIDSEPSERLARWLIEAIDGDAVDDRPAVAETRRQLGDDPAGPATLLPAAIAGLNVMRFLGGIHAVTLAVGSPGGVGLINSLNEMAAAGAFCTHHRSLRSACRWLQGGRTSATAAGVELAIERVRHAEWPPADGGLPLPPGDNKIDAGQLILPSVSEHAIGQLFQMGRCLSPDLSPPPD